MGDSKEPGPRLVAPNQVRTVMTAIAPRASIPTFGPGPPIPDVVPSAGTAGVGVAVGLAAGVAGAAVGVGVRVAPGGGVGVDVGRGTVGVAVGVFVGLALMTVKSTATWQEQQLSLR